MRIARLCFRYTKFEAMLIDLLLDKIFHLFSFWKAAVTSALPRADVKKILTILKDELLMSYLYLLLTINQNHFVRQFKYTFLKFLIKDNLSSFFPFEFFFYFFLSCNCGYDFKHCLVEW